LRLERRAEGIYLRHEIAQRIHATCAPSPDGKVAFTQGKKQIGHRLEGADHPHAGGGCTTEPADDDDHADGPLDLEREVPGQQEHHRHDDGRQPRQQSLEEDVPVVGKAEGSG